MSWRVRSHAMSSLPPPPLETTCPLQLLWACLIYPTCKNSPLSVWSVFASPRQTDTNVPCVTPPAHTPPSHIFTASWRGRRWGAPTRPRTATRSRTGGRWWRSPGRGCAPPWRWCWCSHRWRPRCSTPPIRRPPTLSWWERPLRRPPAAGLQLHPLLIGPTALQRERGREEGDTWCSEEEALCGHAESLQSSGHSYKSTTTNGVFDPGVLHLRRL